MFICFHQELSFLQINLDGKVKVLETDLDTSRATLAALKERNDDLGECFWLQKRGEVVE